MKKRALLKSALAPLLASAFAAQAQATPIKFQLDWRFEGPAATAWAHRGSQGH